MPNKKMFSTKVKPTDTDTVNKAGGKAYSLTDEAALSQYVVTSCFNRTFYASETEQVEKVLQLARSCNTEFVAKCAVYGHEMAGMKDTPALLLAVLTNRGEEGLKLCEKIFPRVITNGKMLFNFAQMIRSGVTGRKSFGTAPKRTITKWLESKTGNQLFMSSIGSNPSMADMIKMVRPKPESEEKKAFYAYLIGRDHDVDSLPSKVQEFEAFKQAKSVGVNHAVPDVPFQMLTALNLTEDEWVQIARNLPWNALRMNLNTLGRHGVFKAKGMTQYVAEKLANPELVRKFNVFPYQLLAAYLNTEDVPAEVRNALQDAMEVATENVPSFDCPVAVCIDSSGSMGSAVTGYRKGSTSKVTCVQVASLVGATIARRNKNTILLPFDTRVHPTNSINERDSIMTNATKLSKFGGGGTDVASAMRVLNGQVGTRPELIIYVSDNESWSNGRTSYGYYGGTGLMQEWAAYKRKTPNAKMVLIDIQASGTTQAPDNGKDVFNIGCFSDRVWPAIKSFVDNDDKGFVNVINKIEI